MWRERATCARLDYQLFFDSRKEKIAKEVCGKCPVSIECRNEAILSQNDDGIWGGLSPDERRGPLIVML